MLNVGKRARAHLFIWPIVLFLIIFNANILLTRSGYIALTYFPTAPREGEPVNVVLTLRNPSLEEQTYRVYFYVDGELKVSGTITLGCGEVQTLSYTVKAPRIGEARRAYVKAETADGKVQETAVSIPQYAPEVWSMFSAIGAFSTTLMGSTTMMSYYTLTILNNPTVNVGLTVSLTLIGLLIFLELSSPEYGRIGKTLSNLRQRYSWLAAILFTIFMGIVITKIMMIIGGI